VGFLPVFFPPEGRLGHAPVHAQPGPVDPLPVLVGHQAGLPQGFKDAGLDPLLEAVVGGRAGAEAGGIQGLPLAAGAEHEQDGLHADAVGGARSAAAVGVGIAVLGQQFADGLPEVVGDAPGFGDVGQVGVRHGFPSDGVSCAENKCSCMKML
jgi:hypothetical protein